MKKLLVATLVLAASAANAQTYTSRPNAYGGYTYQNSNGAVVGSSQPNAYGGYTYQNSNGAVVGSSQPNAYGGYTYQRGW
jgi:hypothetical protein